MSKPLFSELLGPRIGPQIEYDYQIRLIAQGMSSLKDYHLAALHLQAEAAAVQLRMMANLANSSNTMNAHLDQIGEGIGTLLSGVDHINESLEHLNEIGYQTLDAIGDLSQVIEDALTRISLQMIEEGKLLASIDDSLRHPYKSQVRELRDEADKWLKRGAHETGRDQKEDWSDAIRLLRIVLESPIGRQDYVAFFQLGYLLWKLEDNLPAAEVSFHRAQRLSSDSGDFCYVESLRHLAQVQRLQHKYQDAYETINRALETSGEYETIYDGARYSALMGRDEESIGFINKCISAQPATIYTMFSEGDLRSIAPALLELASRRTHEARGLVETGIKRCQPVLDASAKAERDFGLNLSGTGLVAEVETFKGRLGGADYLALLQMRRRTDEIRDKLLEQCSAEIQRKLATARHGVQVAKLELAAAERARESILEQSKRQGQLLIDKVRAQGEADVRRAELGLSAAELKYSEAINASIHPAPWHGGVGYLCGCVTHFLVAMLIVYALYGPKPRAIDNFPLGLWLLTGWILYGFIFRRLLAWLSKVGHLQPLKKHEVECRATMETTRMEQKELLRKAQEQAEGLLMEAKSKASNQFTERFASLENDARHESSEVLKAESTLYLIAQL